MNKENNQNEYKGFSLFNDIEDVALRTRNRAVILANMSEDNLKGGRINPKAGAFILGYFAQIPEDERKDVVMKYTEFMLERGFKIDGK